VSSTAELLESGLMIWEVGRRKRARDRKLTGDMLVSAVVIADEHLR
jgi:hypothetical protein